MADNKVVTIRAVSEHFYTQFQSLTKIIGKNLGPAFSELITFYKQPVPAILGNVKMKKSFYQAFYQQSEYLEIIENLDELVITNQLLSEAGKNVKFLFNNIKSLILDESIDNKTCIHHIYRIKNSKIQVKGHISNLLLLSLKRSDTLLKFKSQDLREVTIRKVTSSAYDHFVGTTKLHNQSIGDAVNELFSQFIPEAEIMFIVMQQLNSNFNNILPVTNIDEEVVVTEQDLLEMQDKRVLFHRIASIKFDDTVQKESFLKFVAGIYNCDKIQLPPSFPKLIELSRIKKFP